MIKVGVVGAGGRMGRMLIEEVYNTEGVTLSAATETKNSSFLGLDAGELAGCGKLGVEIIDDEEKLFDCSDVVIDFTAPAVTVKNAKLAEKYKKALIIGTTGIEKEQQEIINKCSKNTAIVQAPNMSVGVNLLFALVEKVSAILDEDYDIEVLEMHHNKKKDAPSGTALGLGQSIARGRKINLEEKAVKVRDGITGEREKGSVGFATLRGGDVVGEHTVMFACEGERIEITHKASSRKIFAKGAIKASKWIANKNCGLYTMLDILELDKI